MFELSAIPRSMRRLTLSTVALAFTVIVAFFAASAGGATSAAAAATVQQVQSQNWAGYAVGGRKFSSVSGTWVQPRASADPSSPQSYSAFWVGLGGTQSSSSSLEQIGTASDYSGGQAHYYAWYELVPAGQVRLNLAVHPGDTLSGKVTVSGSEVVVSLSDQTTGQSVSRTLQMSNPDTSTAEWIAEAPASESGDGSTQILPLADFGKVNFTNATATAGGHTGGISDPDWSAAQIQLQSGQDVVVSEEIFPGVAIPVATVPQSGAGATTSSLSGSGFSVSWQSQNGGSSGSGGGQFPSSGYPAGPAGGGYGGGYGYGPYPIP